MYTPETKGCRILLNCGALVLVFGFTVGVSADEMVAWDDLPEAVQQAIESKIPEAVGSAVEMEMEDGVAIYEAEVDVDGLEREVEVTAAGTIVGYEEEITPDKLPAEFRAAVQSIFPDAEILEAEMMMSIDYEVNLRVGDRVIEVSTSPSGALEVELEDEDDEDHEDEGEHEDDDDEDEN